MVEGVQQPPVSFSCRKEVGSKRELTYVKLHNGKQLTLNRECLVAGSFNKDTWAGGRAFGDEWRAAESGEGEASRPLSRSRLALVEGGEAVLEGAVWLLGDPGGEAAGRDSDGVAVGGPPGTANASSKANAVVVCPPKAFSKDIPRDSAVLLLAGGDWVLVAPKASSNDMLLLGGAAIEDDTTGS